MEELLTMMLHADETISEIAGRYGTLTYLILFAIIFIETGLVVVTFFPGDGLLISAGILAASGELDLAILVILLTVATVMGHTSNHLIGRYIGERFFKKEKPKRNRYLSKAYHYYEKYGGRAVFASRFFPFLRSFVPFVTGLARMDFIRFTWYNIAGGFIWIVSYLMLGYFFGEIPWVKENYGLVLSIMLLFFLLVMIIGGIRALVQFYKLRIKK